jgi:uncharacterized hydrophobic protein (TIGR00271 family)
MIEIKRKKIEKSYERVKQKSLFDIDYYVLLLLSSIICFWGFKMNSPAVIIGAMVICPMLYSVIGIASSLFFSDYKQLLKELSSLLIEIFSIMLILVVLGNIFSVESNTEISTRIYSQPLDYFFVAFFSGIAATFSIYWPKVKESMVGIAISVALIPPLVLCGIGLAQLDMELLKDSSLIVLTNILGIVLGSLVVLLSLKLLAQKDRD